MQFIDIDGDIINVSRITYISRYVAHVDANYKEDPITVNIKIYFDNDYITITQQTYDKLIEYLNPTPV